MSSLMSFRVAAVSVAMWMGAGATLLASVPEIAITMTTKMEGYITGQAAYAPSILSISTGDVFSFTLTYDSTPFYGPA